MKLFDLQAWWPETSADCSTPYDIIFNNECTVQEFIDEVLTQGKWGYVCIGNYFDGPQIEYRHNKIVSGVFSMDILDAKIKKAVAHGGQARMDYMLDILTEEQKLRNEYTQALKEIIQHEHEIDKLKKKAHDLEDQLDSINAAKTEKHHLDKDGCVYWDSVLK